MEENKGKKSVLYYVMLIGIPLIVISVGYIAYHFYNLQREESLEKYEGNIKSLYETIDSEVEKFDDIQELYLDSFGENSDYVALDAMVADLKEEGIFDELDTVHTVIVNSTKGLNNPPKRFKKIYQEVVALEKHYVNMYEIIEFPLNGNFKKYRKEYTPLNLKYSIQKVKVLEELKDLALKKTENL